MTLHLDASSVEPHIDWTGVMSAIERGHQLAAPAVDDTLLRRSEDSLLSRAAMIDGLGALVKTATVFPGNSVRGIPAIHGSVALFADDTGRLDATVDFGLLTKWKTAADSALASSRLARPDSTHIVIIGAGDVAESMIDAYGTVFPAATFTIWNRSPERAERLAASTGASVAADLEDALGAADIVCAATMSSAPVIPGAAVRPGTHVDLIGGFRADMREAGDDLIERASVFVDCIATATDVGDVAEPIASGLIALESIVDFRALATSAFARSSNEQITVCKNAGGAHLDLMVARHMHAAVTASSS